MPNWTENQYNAIHSTGGSVLVSASAGSGKTAVLVERVINLLTNEKNPIPADRMLVVTYTKAAAAEMKERITSRISDLIHENPYDTNLRKQQLKLQNAHISTIHSCCSDIVREHFYLLGISRDFRIADDGELLLLKNEAVNRVFDELYEQDNNRNFLNLVEAFSGNKDDKALQNVVFKLYEFLRSHPFPDVWLNEKLSYYDSPQSIGSTVWGDIIFDYCKAALDFAKSLCSANENIICNEPVLSEKLPPVITDDLDWIKRILNAINSRNWDLTRNILTDYTPMRMPIIKGYKDNPDKLRFSKNREDIKKIIKDLFGYFLGNEKECVEDINILQPIVREMFYTVKKFSSEFEKIKGENNVLDFSDLEHLTLKLLVKYDKGKTVLTEEAEKIAQSFDEVMVDEYQDANEVQDIIFKALSGDEKNLFVVGDVKQSIYSFRQAMPQIFLNRKEKYPIYNRETDNYPSRIILEKNFRSRKEITDSVNFVFKGIMSRECGEIEYSEEENLVYGASYNESADTKVSLSLLDMDTQEESDACIVEADYIAKEIFRIINEKKVNDKGNLRNPLYGDFAILLRNSNSYAQTYVKRLKDWGIPAASSVSEEFLSTREITIIINLLRIIDNPLQDIPLLSVMMSPLYCFEADDLAQMRTNTRYTNIYSALKIYGEKGNQKAVNFLNDLKKFRTYAVTKPIHLLINKIYEETFYPEILKGMYQSDLPYNNILLFKDYAYDYEKNGCRGLSSFINYIDNLIKNGSDLASCKDSRGNSLNCVRVMSIHSSKGLEFPFVFLANTARKFVSDSSDNVLIHKELGFTLKRRDSENYAMYNTLPRAATAIKMQASEKSEEMRILYVALTRAREELHMVCARDKMTKYISDLGGKITSSQSVMPFIVSSAKRLSDWLILCGLIHIDGSVLRKIAGIDNFSKYIDCPKWDIKYISDYDNLYNQGNDCGEKEDDDNTTANNVDSELNSIDKVYEVTDETDNVIDEIIKNRLMFTYKNSDINAIPVKVSVSDISHNKSKERFSKILSRPEFMSEKSMTPTERGTAVHNALQHIDFAAAKTDIDKEIERLTNSGYITAAQSNVIDKSKLIQLINSPIITDVINSDVVYREFRFNTVISAGDALEVIPDSVKDKEIILQGSVDLAYLKDGMINVVDYKTDRVNSMGELKDLYTQQLLLYKGAMEQCTPYKVNKCIIYSIRLGEFVEV